MIHGLLGLSLFVLISLPFVVESSCSRECNLAFASYYVWQGSNLSFMAEVLQSSILPVNGFDVILEYNTQLTNKSNVEAGTRVRIPFPCDCINDEFLGHVFTYSIWSGDTYDLIATKYYANLTTVAQLQQFNTYNPNNLPDNGSLNVTVNCSCGNRKVSMDYGLFMSYPLLPGETLDSVLTWTNLTTDMAQLVQSYNPGVNFSQGSGLVFVPSKDANDSFRPLKPSTGGLAGGVIAGISIGAVVGLLLLGIGLYVGFYRRKKVKEAMLLSIDSQNMSVQGGQELLVIGPRINTFSYAELRAATDDFSPSKKLGEGGFGPVYMGKLSDGRVVAVKQLSVASRQGKSQFVTEIATISGVQHRNLVKLYGYCIEGNRRLLIYEYLKNKSLDQALFGNKGLHLDWPTRFSICVAAARGLAYLHEESRPRIIHRDVKASNILLDAELCPKISDFGLAKLYDDKKTHISTCVAGTIGYLAPEYAMRGHLTEKTDVFSFGVVTLEILSGRPNFNNNEDNDKISLLEWAWTLYESNQSLGLLDPTLVEFNQNEALRMIGVGLLCTQASPMMRPPMSRVIAMLVGDIEVIPVASKPSYLTDWDFKDITTSIEAENTPFIGSEHRDNKNKNKNNLNPRMELVPSP